MPKANETIGRIKCDCCAEEAALKQSANGLAYYVCQWCSYKGQSFNGKSDKNLRDRARITMPVPPLPKADPVPETQTPPAATKRAAGTLLG